MPAPITDENILFNEILTPSIVLKDDAGIRYLIPVASLDATDLARVHNMYDKYGSFPSVASAGSQVVDFGGTVVGGNPTGLANDATVYSCTVTVDGVAVPIAITGSAAQTFTTLVSEIDTDLGAVATATIDAGDIKIESATTGFDSTVVITPGNIFSSATGFVAFMASSSGVGAAADFLAAFDLEIIPNLSQTFTATYGGVIKQVGAKPIILAGGPNVDSTDVYWNGTDWVRLVDDAAI